MNNIDFTYEKNVWGKWTEKTAKTPLRLGARWLQWIWKLHCKIPCEYNDSMDFMCIHWLSMCACVFCLNEVYKSKMGSVWQWWSNCTPPISTRYLMFWAHWGVRVYLCVAFLFSRKGEKKQCNSCQKSTCSLAVSFWDFFISYLVSAKTSCTSYIHRYSYHTMIICVAHVSTAKLYMHTGYKNWTGKLSWTHGVNFQAHQIRLN